VLDDLVLDISSFKLSHPGGKFVLEYNVGRDVSKFFYGGYTLETSSGLKPHTHSNMARYIANSLIIARLEEKA
jgi:cytochrome b involved in lipid metabolism